MNNYQEYEYSIEGSQHFNESYSSWKKRNNVGNEQYKCKYTLDRWAARDKNNKPCLVFFLYDNNGKFFKFVNEDDTKNISEQILNDIKNTKYKSYIYIGE